jgi:hypothetical protein
VSCLSIRHVHTHRQTLTTLKLRGDWATVEFFALKCLSDSERGGPTPGSAIATTSPAAGATSSRSFQKLRPASSVVPWPRQSSTRTGYGVCAAKCQKSLPTTASARRHGCSVAQRPLTWLFFYPKTCCLGEPYRSNDYRHGRMRRPRATGSTTPRYEDPVSGVGDCAGLPNSAGVMIMMFECSYVCCKSKNGKKTSTNNPALGTESQDNRIARGA